MLPAFVPVLPRPARPRRPQHSFCSPRGPRYSPSAAPRACLPSGHSPTHQPDDLWHAPLWCAPITPPVAARDAYETDLSSNDPPPPPAAGGRDDDNESRADVLARFGRDDHTDLASLSAPQLAAYLKASQNGFVRWLCRVWPGWRRRVAADPDFPFKVLMEETVGLGLAASGMIAARGKDILAELDFAFCDIAVGGTLNFILVYLLTPAIGASAGRFAGLPASAFSPGNFGVPARLGSFLYKGALFSACGFAGSLVGTTLSQTLVLVRRVVAKVRGVDNGTAKKLPNVAVNSAAWAGFMLVSSNPRYQTVAGLERLLFGFAPEPVAKLGSGALRTANNILGGANWVWWARAIGLQHKPVPEEVKE